MQTGHNPQAAWWRRAAWLAALAPVVLGVGCETHAGTGMLAGGALGALAGGAIGAATHHAGAGALIGAATGTAVGGLAGAAADNHEQKVAMRQAAERRALGLNDVVELTRNGTSDDIIINQIRTSGTVFHLSGDEIVWLQQNNVHDCVIKAMQATASLPPAGPPVVYVHEQPRVIYMEPPPPPPPSVGVGFVIHGH
jgi:hypothetical protein